MSDNLRFNVYGSMQFLCHKHERNRHIEYACETVSPCDPTAMHEKIDLIDLFTNFFFDSTLSTCIDNSQLSFNII